MVSFQIVTSKSFSKTCFASSASFSSSDEEPIKILGFISNHLYDRCDNFTSSKTKASLFKISAFPSPANSHAAT